MMTWRGVDDYVNCGGRSRGAWWVASFVGAASQCGGEARPAESGRARAQQKRAAGVGAERVGRLGPARPPGGRAGAGARGRRRTRPTSSGAKGFFGSQRAWNLGRSGPRVKGAGWRAARGLAFLATQGGLTAP
jgi:hypothetical protein